MDTRHFHKHLFGTGRRLIHAGGAVVAVSGGADSMALLHGLHAVNTMRDCGWRLHVAHLDHGLRGDSPQAAEFVQQIASDLGLPCSARERNVHDLSQSAGTSIEEAARNARYAFLEDVARQQRLQTVAVAHHADDQAETVLHRILRGTGLTGLAGIPERRPIREDGDIEIVRPLLTLRRSDLLAYLHRKRLSWLEDATNQDIHAATRNRIRHDLLPMIATHVNPEIVPALARLAEHADRSSRALRQLARGAFSGIVLDSPTGEVLLGASALASLPRALQAEVVVLSLALLGVARQSIGFERIEAVADLADGEGHPRRIELAGGVSVHRRGDRLRFAADAAWPSPRIAPSASSE